MWAAPRTKYPNTLCAPFVGGSCRWRQHIRTFHGVYCFIQWFYWHWKTTTHIKIQYNTLQTQLHISTHTSHNSSFIPHTIHSTLFIHHTIHSSNYSFIHHPIRSFIHHTIHSFIILFIHSFIHHSINSFINPLIHSLIHSLTRSTYDTCVRHLTQ